MSMQIHMYHYCLLIIYLQHSPPKALIIRTDLCSVKYAGTLFDTVSNKL